MQDIAKDDSQSREKNDFWGEGIDNDNPLLRKRKSLVDSKITPRIVWYGKSIIKSCARLDYKTAQHIIDGLNCKKHKGRRLANVSTTTRCIL